MFGFALVDQLFKIIWNHKGKFNKKGGQLDRLFLIIGQV
jgi:hypothetical protein